jgi:hypothetical protein
MPYRLKYALVVSVIAVIFILSVGAVILLQPSSKSHTASTSHVSTNSSGTLSITSPQNGGQAAVYNEDGSLGVQGTANLGPDNWLYDPSHSVDLTKPSSSGCITDPSEPAPYMSILSVSVFPKAEQIGPSYILEQLGIQMYLNNLTSLSSPTFSPGSSSLGWFFYFSFSNRSFYAGMYWMANSSSAAGTQASAPAGLSYWYGPWSGNRPVGETQTNGSIFSEAEGGVEIDFPPAAVGNVTKGDTLTNMGLLTLAGTGTAPDRGSYCTDDSYGGTVSYRLFDPLLPAGTIQVAAVPSCPSSQSTAALNWTTAVIQDPNNPFDWTASVPTSGQGPYMVYAQELQNGKVVEGPISINATIYYYTYATYSYSQFPSGCSTT